MAAKMFLVMGRVQGVGFRDFARRQATALRLTGYARNLHDGGVEIFAEGQGKALETFSGFIRKGPPWAEVRSFDVKEAAEQDLADFTIR